MSTVDNVWDNVKAVFDMAEKKTAQTYELSKKKIQEKKLEDKLDSLYIKLGKMCYESRKKDTCANSEDAQKTVELIDSVKAELKSLRAEIKNLRYSKVCSECGAGMRKDDDFCSKCGAKTE